MDFTVVDDIKETAATVSDLAQQAKEFADEKLDAAKNFVCVEILTIYQMAYATAGQVINIPYMAIKLAKRTLCWLNASVVQGARDTFGSAVATLMTTYTGTTVKYDPDTGRCTTETKPSKIQSDPSYVQQALHAMKAAKNCPLLDSVTSTSGFNTAFSLTKLLAAMENTTEDEATAAFANALTNLATGIVDNLATDLKDTAFGKLNEARKMYKAALTQSGVEELFKLMGIGQSCLLDLCDDRAVLLKMEDMPLTPYLAKAGGFVKEHTAKVDGSYFTFTFDLDKSTGADQLTEEQQIDTTLYEPLPVITGIKFTTAGAKSAAEVLGEPYYTYYKNLASYIRGGGKDDYQMLKKLHMSYDYSHDEVVASAQVFLQTSSYMNFMASYKGYQEEYTADGAVAKKVPVAKLNEGGFTDVVIEVKVRMQELGILADENVSVNLKILTDSSEGDNPILSALSSADFVFACTEPGELEEMNDGAAYCPLCFYGRKNATDATGNITLVISLQNKFSDSSEQIPTYFDTYTTSDLKSNYTFKYFTDAEQDSLLPVETTGAYTLFPFKQK